MKIALHDNSLNIRGTSVAIYDYAFYLKKKYNIEPIILHCSTNRTNDINVINKFKEKFVVHGYNNVSQIDDILKNEKCDTFFMIKSGKRDGVLSSVCKNFVMAVSTDITKNDIHGDKYFVCSKWLSQQTGIDYVPHMINLPDNDLDLRNELNIPEGAIVFGRNGGYETFDLNFVKDAIKKDVVKHENHWYLFQNTERFINHERVIYLEPNTCVDFKVKFINTCDVHLHARRIGESFGLTCGEFSIKNKQVMCWDGSPERNHIDILGEKVILYNQTNISGILDNFVPNKTDNNCYNDYTPEKVMSMFVKKYDIEQ